MNIKRIILLRVWIVFILFLLLGVVIAIQISRIQINEGKYWRAFSDSILLKTVQVEAIRGNIFTFDGKLLATSLPYYDIRIDFHAKAWKDKKIFNQNIDSLSYCLSMLYNNKSAIEYKMILKEGRRKKSRYFLLFQNVTHENYKKIETFPIFRLGKSISGCIVDEKSRREHPYDPLARRFIGPKYPDKKHIYGFESSFDNYLSGQSGNRLMQKISGGNWIPIDYENDIEPQDGKDIITTVDINIQEFAENALLNGLIKNKADYGCAVVMDVSTGKILAIANLTRHEEDVYTEDYNYAIGSSLEPGSTFKLASAILLLDNDFVDPDYVVDTKNGKWKIYDREIKDTKDGGLGKITFSQAFELSSNVAFAKLVHTNFSRNPSLFYKGLQKLHMTDSLHISITGEGMPKIKEPQKWDGTSLAFLAHGYELQLTPLHLLTLFNAIANNGTMVKPIFITEVRQAGSIVKEFGPEVIAEKICSDKTLKFMKSLLEGVVNEGTANNIYTDRYGIAGKTGTAKKLVNGKYANIYRASFAGYFPSENPKYSCIVLIDNPTGGEYYGAKVAGPVFKEIADKLFGYDIRLINPATETQAASHENIELIPKASWEDYLNLGKYLGITFSSNGEQSEWAFMDKSKSGYEIKPHVFKPNTVPDVIGMTITDAVYLLENLGYKIETYGYGKVQKQSILPGTKVKSKITIKLILG